MQALAAVSLSLHSNPCTEKGKNSDMMPVWTWLKRWLSILAVILISAAVLAGLAHYFLTFQGARRDEAAEPPRSRPVVSVSIATVAPQTLQETVFGVGTLKASAEVELSPEIAGRIRGIHFEEGALVEEGQVLFELDDDRLRYQRDARQAAVRAAAVRAANARRVVERWQQLRQRQVVTEEAFEQAEADLDAAVAEQERLEAEVTLIERELEDTKIRAPFSGVVSQHEVERGLHVTVGKVLAHLYQLEPLELQFWLPERHLGRVRPGQPVAVAVAAYPGRAFAGQVEFVSPAVDPSSRQFLVKALIPNQERELRPGLFATASVVVGELADRPVIPEEALVATRRGYLVFVVEDGVALSREIVTGLRHEGVVEIVEGLAVGEHVVREGHLRLNGGEQVRAEADS